LFFYNIYAAKESSTLFCDINTLYYHYEKVTSISYMLHFSFSAQALSSIPLRYISLPCVSLRPHKRLVRFCFATSHYRASRFVRTSA